MRAPRVVACVPVLGLTVLVGRAPAFNRRALALSSRSDEPETRNAYGSCLLHDRPFHRSAHLCSGGQDAAVRPDPRSGAHPSTHPVVVGGWLPRIGFVSAPLPRCSYVASGEPPGRAEQPPIRQRAAAAIPRRRPSPQSSTTARQAPLGNSEEEASSRLQQLDERHRTNVRHSAISASRY